MSTTLEYLEELQKLKENLIVNLNAKGVSVQNTEGFNTLIPKVLDIDTSKKYYKEITLYEPSQSILIDDIPFEPKSFMFNCAIRPSDMVNYIPDVENKKTYCQWSYNYSDNAVVEGQQFALIQNAFVAKTNPVSYVLNISTSHTKTYNPNTNKWEINMMRNDSASIAFRFAGSQNGIIYQILIFG